jgi:hypothetical protein
MRTCRPTGGSSTRLAVGPGVASLSSLDGLAKFPLTTKDHLCEASLARSTGKLKRVIDHRDRS